MLNIQILKKLVMKIFIILLCAFATSITSALPHNYDLPFNCIDSGNLPSFQQSKKSELENKVTPALKQLMKEGGQMSALFAISYKGRELSNCAIGYADYDSAERLAKGLPVLPLQANAAGRGASLAKPIARAAIKKCVEMGLCDYNENLLAASGVKVWRDTVQPWHSQCTFKHAVEPVTTGCNIPNGGIETSDIDVAALTGYVLPLSFSNRLSYDTSINIQRTQPTSNLAYILIGAIIEKKTGRNYYDWVRENITDKAGIARESMVQSLGTLQLMGTDENGKPIVVNGREPGEMSYDGRDIQNIPDYRTSYYDGKAIVRNPESALIENYAAAAGWTGTTDAWLRFASIYSDDGTYAPMKNSAAGSITANGEFFGTSSFMYRTPNGNYAFVLNFNRYSTVADGNVISTAAWLKLRAILDSTDLSSYTYDLWDIGTTADQVVRSYMFSKVDPLQGPVFRYFAASPEATKTLDGLIASDPNVGFARTTESWKMWKVGTPGTVPVCRYFYPPAATHFWGKYEDCKLVQMLFPNQENYIDTFHFEEMTLAAKLVNASGTCDAPTVPLYRGFRSVNGPVNHQYVVSGPNAVDTAKGYAIEGIAFCVMPN
jgi:hypothetical protein